MSDAAPNAEKQRHVIENLTHEPAASTRGYLVAEEWYKKWQAYVGYATQPTPDKADRPGSLTMQELLGVPINVCHCYAPIMVFPSSSNMLVDEKIWCKWVEWYGVANSHHLDRVTYSNRSINNNWQDGRVQQTMTHAIFQICLLSLYSLPVTHPTKIFDIAEECGYIELQLRRMFDVPASRKTRLWVRHTSPEALFKLASPRCYTLSRVLPQNQQRYDTMNNQEQTIALEVCQTYGTCNAVTREYSEEYFNQYLPLTQSQRHIKMREEDLYLTVKSMIEGFSSTLQETVGGIVELGAKTKQVSKSQKELGKKFPVVCEKGEELKAKEEQLETEREKVKEDRKKLRLEIERMSEMNEIHKGLVKLNVGGHLYTTSTLTLTKDEDSMLAAMFSGRHSVQREEDGSYFVDRDGTHFRYILNYLRDGGFDDGSLPSDRSILKELLTEARYYQLSGLVALLQDLLSC